MTFELQLNGCGPKNFTHALRTNNTTLPPQTELPSAAYGMTSYPSKVCIGIMHKVAYGYMYMYFNDKNASVLWLVLVLFDVVPACVWCMIFCKKKSRIRIEAQLGIVSSKLPPPPKPCQIWPKNFLCCDMTTVTSSSFSLCRGWQSWILQPVG